MKFQFLTNIIVFLLFFGLFDSLPGSAQTTVSQTQARVVDSSVSEKEKLEVFDEVWKTVNRYYYDEKFNGIDWNKARQDFRPKALEAKDKTELADVLQQMLDQLKVSHLGVWWENLGLKKKQISAATGQHFDSKKFDLQFRFGFSTRKFEDRWLVTAVDANSSAEVNGVRRGWTAKNVNGVEYPASKVFSKLTENEEAEFVFLDEKSQERKIRMTRKFYLVPRYDLQRESRILENDILYLKFSAFTPETEKWFEEEVRKNLARRAMIIDLRENFGGRVSSVKETLSQFFPKNTFVGEFIERDGDDKNLKVGKDAFYKGKLIVLTDAASASGAEVFASAIQELGRGKLIGAKTSGAVLASAELDLPLGFKMQIPIRDYKTKNNFRIEGTGVTPDLAIQPTIADFYQNNDRTLAEAVQILTEK